MRCLMANRYVVVFVFVFLFVFVCGCVVCLLALFYSFYSLFVVFIVVFCLDGDAVRRTGWHDGTPFLSGVFFGFCFCIGFVWC